MKIARFLSMTVAALAVLGAAQATSAKDPGNAKSVATAKEVLVRIDGTQRWVVVPAESETDTLGRISKVVIDGRQREVLATKHKLDGHTIIVDRVAYEGDVTPKAPAPATASKFQ